MVKAGDYVVVSSPKKALVLASSESQGEIKPSFYVEEPTLIDFKPEDVVANLGTSPMIGTVFGCKVEPLVRTLVHESFGDVHFFYKPVKAFRQALWDSLDFAYEQLEKHNLTEFMPCTLEVRQPSGKYAGYYKYSGRDISEKPDVLCVKPADISAINYVVLHECGHGVWFRQLRSSKWRARWVKLYHKAVSVVEIETKEVMRILKGIQEQDDTGLVSDYRGQLSEDDQRIFDACTAYISDYHNLDVKALDVLFQSGDDLTSLWPTVVHVSDMSTHLTEYAMKSPEEYFAESFGLYMAGKKLPATTNELMVKTLAYLK